MEKLHAIENLMQQAREICAREGKISNVKIGISATRNADIHPPDGQALVYVPHILKQHIHGALSSYPCVFTIYHHRRVSMSRKTAIRGSSFNYKIHIGEHTDTIIPSIEQDHCGRHRW